MKIIAKRRLAALIALCAAALLASCGAALAGHDDECGPDGLSFAYHREWDASGSPIEQGDAVAAEEKRQKRWMGDYYNRLLASLSDNPKRAGQLRKAQAAWEKWIDLDFKFREQAAPLGTMYIWMAVYDKLMCRVERTVFMRSFALDYEESGSWEYSPERSGSRPSRGGLARDADGYTKKYMAERDAWDGATSAFLEITGREIERQDKWLNELYQALRKKLGDSRKTALRDAQRAWLAWREADSDFIYDPDGGTIARMDASDDFLSKLVSRVAWLEDILSDLEEAEM